MNIRRAFTQMTLARLVVLVVATLSLMVVSRLLPPAAFGVFMAIVAVTELVTVLADFGISARIDRKSSLTDRELGAASGLALAIALPVAGIVALCALLLPESLLTGEARGAVALLALGLPVLALGNPLEAALRREIRFGLVSVLSIARAVAEALATITLALMGFGVLALAAGRLAQHALPAVILLALKLRRGGWRPRAEGWGEYLGFGSTYSGTQVIQKGGSALVVWLVNLLLGVATLGLLNRARRVVELLDRSLLDGIISVVLPAVSRSLDSGHDPGRLYLAKVDHLAALCWPVFAGIILLTEPLVRVVLGPQWDAAVPVVRILALAGFLQPVSKMSVQMFVALDILPVYTRILTVQQVARVLLMGGGALISLEAACAGSVLATALKAALIGRSLGARTGYPRRALGGIAARAGALSLLAMTGPVLLLIAAPDWPALPLLLAGIGLAAAGWIAGGLLLRHPLMVEGLSALGAHRSAARLRRDRGTADMETP